MYPQSVEIKANVADDAVAQAIDTLDLREGRKWRIHFCEDVTAGVAPATPLLDVGVVLRARSKGQDKGDTTVKLRPCRWSQLEDDFLANQERDSFEYKVEADWGARSRSLSASLTVKWDDDQLGDVLSGAAQPPSLFSQDQLRFLRSCARERVNLAAIRVLPGIEATRWEPFATQVAGKTLSVRAERWTVTGSFDFLELSIVSTVPEADADQVTLGELLTAKAIPLDLATTNKTERVLRSLVGGVTWPQ